MKWLAHAFAIGSSETAAPNDIQREVVEKLCAEIVRRQLETPALMLLEMGRPLNYVSAQFLHFVQPFAPGILNKQGYEEFAHFLEQRGSMDYICKRLEAASK